mmetsp:Transcript_24101/g.38966  ORF Transcript_24101/g.38966 Transcript_24101/m.38966 type:complete len:240 (-) Transcript_24101:104-823(-)
MFVRCDLLKPLSGQFDDFMARFKAYRANIPVYGAILLNKEMTKTVLVQGYQGNSWGFPKGKVNQAEDECVCAAREVYEEIGYDCAPLMNAKDYVKTVSKQGKMIKLFIVPGVPEDFHFEPQVRKEIGDIRWFDLKVLPQTYQDTSKRFWSMSMFTPQLFRWIKRKQTNRPNSRAKGRGRDEKSSNKSPVRDRSPANRSPARELAKPRLQPKQKVKQTQQNKLFNLDVEQVFDAMSMYLV